MRGTGTRMSVPAGWKFSTPHPRQKLSSSWISSNRSKVTIPLNSACGRRAKPGPGDQYQLAHAWPGAVHAPFDAGVRELRQDDRQGFRGRPRQAEDPRRKIDPTIHQGEENAESLPVL